MARAELSGSFLRWQSCIGWPRRAKLALSLPIKGPTFCVPDWNGAGRSPEEQRKFEKRTDAVPPSPNGATSCLWKEANALRPAAPVTQAQIS